jgi:Ca-activated chloride channel family protein
MKTRKKKRATSVIAEVRAQYVLTYYSSANATPGTFRKIRVGVKRPGTQVQVRARRGYYTPKEQ